VKVFPKDPSALERITSKAKAAVKAARLPTLDELTKVAKGGVGLAKRNAPALLFAGGSILAAQLNKPDIPKTQSAKSGASAARQKRAELAARKGFQSTVLTPLGGSSRARLGTPTLLGG